MVFLIWKKVLLAYIHFSETGLKKEVTSDKALVAVQKYKK